MIATLGRLGASRGWWFCVLLAAAVGEGTALYFQYVLYTEPCVLCVQIRIWMAGLLLVGLLGTLWNPQGAMACVMQVLTAGLTTGQLERSWQAWATENGVADGSCGMSANLPAWFALDRWIPAVFEPREMCGYTPEMFAGFSMADLLLYGSASALALVVILVIAQLLLLLGSGQAVSQR